MWPSTRSDAAPRPPEPPPRTPPARMAPVNAAPQQGYSPAEPAYRRVTVALFLAGMATFASIYSTQTLLPVLAHDFAITPTTAALSVSVTTICLGIALLFVGPLSDALGRVRLMQASLVATGITVLASSFVTDWAHMLLLRGVLGFAVAGLPAVATAYRREDCLLYTSRCV